MGLCSRINGMWNIQWDDRKAISPYQEIYVNPKTNNPLPCQLYRPVVAFRIFDRFSWWIKENHLIITTMLFLFTETNDFVIHYPDALMSAMTSQITSPTNIYSTVYTGTGQGKHRQWSLWGEFTGDRWIPHTKGQYRGKCFHLMTSSCDLCHKRILLLYGCQLCPARFRACHQYSWHQGVRAPGLHTSQTWVQKAATVKPLV